MIQGQTSVYTDIAQAAIAAIKGSAASITATLNTAAGNILKATLTATGEINTRAAILIQSEVDMLAKDLQTVATILQNINATVTIVSTHPRGLELATIWAVACRDTALEIIS